MRSLRGALLCCLIAAIQTCWLGLHTQGAEVDNVISLEARAQGTPGGPFTTSYLDFKVTLRVPSPRGRRDSHVRHLADSAGLQAVSSSPVKKVQLVYSFRTANEPKLSWSRPTLPIDLSLVSDFDGERTWTGGHPEVEIASRGQYQMSDLQFVFFLTHEDGSITTKNGGGGPFNFYSAALPQLAPNYQRLNVTTKNDGSDYDKPKGPPPFRL